MKKTNEKAANVKNSTVAAVVTNEVSKVEKANESEKANETENAAPAVSMDEFEESGTKKAIVMSAIREHFRRPMPEDSEVIFEYYSYNESSFVEFDNFDCANIGLSRDIYLTLPKKSRLSLWLSTLDAKTAGEMRNTAKKWYGDFGGYDNTVSLDVILSHANTTDLRNIYGAEIKKDWLFCDKSLVSWSNTNKEGDRLEVAPGLYCKKLVQNTCNIIRAIQSVGVFLDFKRREIKKGENKSFARDTQLLAYLARVLNTGLQTPDSIFELAKNAQKQIEEQKADTQRIAQENVAKCEFLLEEREKQLATLQAIDTTNFKAAKLKKHLAKIEEAKKMLSAANTSLSVAQKELAKLG